MCIKVIYTILTVDYSIANRNAYYQQQETLQKCTFIIRFTSHCNYHLGLQQLITFLQHLKISVLKIQQKRCLIGLKTTQNSERKEVSNNQKKTGKVVLIIFQHFSIIQMCNNRNGDIAVGFASECWFLYRVM